MRPTIVATAMAAIMLGAAGCGSSEQELTGPAADDTPGPDLISTEQFCGDYFDAEIRPALEAWGAAVAQGEQGAETGDDAMLEAALEQMEAATMALSRAYQQAAEVVDDEDVAAASARFAEVLADWAPVAGDRFREAIDTPGVMRGADFQAFNEAGRAVSAYCN